MEFKLVENNLLGLVDIQLSEHKTEKFEFKIKNQTPFGVSLSEVIHVSNTPSYTGTYNVTPDFVDQTLKTANKLMADDVTIQKIPHSEVGNSAGGRTFYIGEMK